MYVELFILIVIVLLSLVAFVRQKYSFWSQRNVPFIKPRFPYGNLKDVNKKSLADMSMELYNQMKEKRRFFGLYFFFEPLMVITDLDLIKAILIKDFNYFPDRGVYYNAKDDPLSADLFSIEGDEWRSLRNRLSPSFTSGKMKLMFPTLRAVGDSYSEFLVRSVGSGSEMEVKDFVTRFTIEVIGSCAFGIDVNSFNNPDNIFRKYGQEVFDKPPQSPMIRLLLRLYPDFGRILRIRVYSGRITGFFHQLIAETVDYRQKNEVKRNDFLQLLMKMRNKISLNEIAAQSLLFFGAGFETSSSNQTFCLYELALNQDCQEKARESIRSAIEKHGGLTYEAVSDMKYLDQCVKETLRLYPTLPVLERKTSEAYRIPGSDTVIPKNTKTFIPVFAIHRDEQIYPNPLAFDPDRFHPKKVAKRHICSFLSFGEGPRACIAFRFGTLQSMIGLAMVLSKFRVLPCPRTVIPMEYSVKSVVLRPKEHLWLKLEPL